MSAMSQGYGFTEARSNGSDSTEPDSPSWLDGPTLETPMPRDVRQFDACCRGAYNLGVTDERLRRVRLLLGELK